MAKQSREDQIRRIENFTCPIHGVQIGQVDFPSDGTGFNVGGCSREDCDIRVIVERRRNGSSWVPAIRQVVTAKQLRKLQSMWDEKFRHFCKETAKALDAELEMMATEPAAQLPVARK
ncbi:hypothetical protein [Candidatus Korobacter versatilis]|uniref:hypothetical protein n=1 Tax=Candidatus Korobacter versatilis TaxID=658062 RepID=UPI0011D04F05|nr:hypothetical protein [Candidatus Koribacter versatilis]